MPKPDATPGRKESVASIEGSQGAFAQHFTQSFPVLWTIAAGIVGDRAMAEDIVQEAALIGLGKFEQFQPGTSFTAWMGQMVRNVALNAARKQRRQRTGALDGDAEGSVPAKGSAAREAGQDLPMMAQGRLPANQHFFDDQIMRALDEIGPAARACLLLRTIEGMEYSEISKLLEIPQGTAMSHVHRSREFLRRRLGGVQPTSTAGDQAGQPPRAEGATSKPV